MIGYIYAVILAISWSLAAILYGYSLRHGDALIVTLIRIYPALIVTIIATMLMEPFDIERLLNPYLIYMAIITGALGILIGSYAYIYAIKNVGVTITYPIAFSYPLYVSLITVLMLGEPLSIGLIIGLCLQLTGIIILSTRNNNSEILHTQKGVLAAIIASIAWTSNAVLVKIALFTAPPVLFALMRLLSLSVLSTPIFLARYNKIKEFSNSEILAACIGGALGIGVGIVLYHLAIMDIGAARTTIISSSSPGLSILLALVLLKERPGKRALLGAILVTIAIMFVILF